MTRTFKQRILFTLAFMSAMVALCAAVGYWCGRAVALRHGARDLDGYAHQLQIRSDEFLGEAFRTLLQVQMGTAPACSEQELTQFRQVGLQARFVNEVGRLKDGRIVCMASQGRLKNPLPIPQAYFIEEFEGAHFAHYHNFPSEEAGQDKHGISLGDYFLVLNRYRFTSLVPDGVEFYYRSGRFNADRLRKMPLELQWIYKLTGARSGVVQQDGVLYVTRCGSRIVQDFCATTYYPVRTALRNYHDTVLICSFSGAVMGFLLGMYGVLLFRRNQGMERQLRRAIRKDALQLVYQPIVSLRTGRMVAAEALSRWSDADGFAINPAVFVAIAEQHGFIGDLTRLVVRRGLRELKPIFEADPRFRLNINVSVFDLSGLEFPAMLDRELKAAGVPAEQLAIEITEGATARSLEVRQTISELRQKGHSVEIDDFGTGYSSLSYLHSLSVDAIKIDRSFTQAVGTEAVTVSILPQILEMARSLHLHVIAEGIETPEQAAYFAGSDLQVLGQGWLFDRPMTAEQLMVRFRAEAPRTAPLVETESNTKTTE